MRHLFHRRFTHKVKAAAEVMAALVLEALTVPSPARELGDLAGGGAGASCSASANMCASLGGPASGGATCSSNSEGTGGSGGGDGLTSAFGSNGIGGAGSNSISTGGNGAGGGGRRRRQCGRTWRWRPWQTADPISVELALEALEAGQPLSVALALAAIALALAAPLEVRQTKYRSIE